MTGRVIFADINGYYFGLSVAGEAGQEVAGRRVPAGNSGERWGHW